MVVCGKHFGNMIIGCYQEMRAEDPAQAEDFKKQMTERFCKILMSLVMVMMTTVKRIKIRITIKY